MADDLTYDPSTKIGMVRLYTGDKDMTDPIFTDAEIDIFLKQNAGNVYLAAADALDIIATNDAYTLKVITILDVSTNGKATAEGIRASAAALRKKADDEDANTIQVGVAGGFNYVDLEDVWWML